MYGSSRGSTVVLRDRPPRSGPTAEVRIGEHGPATPVDADVVRLAGEYRAAATALDVRRDRLLGEVLPYAVSAARAIRTAGDGAVAGDGRGSGDGGRAVLRRLSALRSAIGRRREAPPVPLVGLPARVTAELAVSVQEYRVALTRFRDAERALAGAGTCVYRRAAARPGRVAAVTACPEVAATRWTDAP